MTETFTIPFVDEALGNSILYEDCKGDFAQARRVAEESVHDARQRGDATPLADALLARGVVHLLQGQYPAAIADLEEAERAVPNDSGRVLRALNYAWLALEGRYNNLPNHSSPSGGDYVAWGQEACALAESQSRRRNLLPDDATSTALRLETELVTRLLCGIVPLARRWLSGGWGQHQSEPEGFLKAALQSVSKFCQEVEAMSGHPRLLAYADLLAADLYRRARQPQRAAELLREASATYEEVADQTGAAVCLLAKGDWLAAPDTSPLLWNHVLHDNDPWARAAEETQADRASLAEVRTAYARAERRFRAAGARRGLAAIQLRYGYLATLIGDFQRAAGHADQARHLFEAVEDSLGAHTATAHRVLDLIGLGRLPENAGAAKAIGRWGREEGSLSFALGLGLLFSRVGRRWLMRDGDFERSLACYRLAESLFQELRAADNQAQALIDQGDIHKIIGDVPSALRLYEQASSVCEDALGSEPHIAAQLWRQAYWAGSQAYFAYHERADPDGVARSVARLEAILARVPEAAQADPLDALGFQGQTDLARELVEQSAVMVPLYRARRARAAGDTAAARELFDQALAATHRISPGQRDLAEVRVLGDQGRYEEAAAAFRRYFEREQADIATFDTSIPQLASFAGSRRVTLHQQAAQALVRVRAYAEARVHLETLEQLAGTDWWRGNERPWEPLGDYGEISEGLGEFSRALEYYDRAIEELETRRGRLGRDEFKTALVSGKGVQGLYFRAARTALRLRTEADRVGDALESEAEAAAWASRAFSYAERGKARALLDLIAGSAARSASSSAESEALGTWRQANAQLALTSGLLAGERGKEEADPARLSDLERRVDVAEQELRIIEERLADSDPLFSRAINPQTQIMSLEEVAAVLPEGTALLEYYFLGGDLLLWGVTNRGVVQARREAVDAEALDQRILGFHRACEQRQPVDGVDAELAEILLAPLAETIRMNQHLIVVPYGTAHVLPFHALPWEGRPLGSTLAVSYLPSASMLRFLRAARVDKLRDRVLAIGNPTDMSYRPPLRNHPVHLDPLPAAETEAAYVASLFPGSRVLTGREATEPEVREHVAKYSLLHFATHGYLSQEAPLLSSILLAEGEALSVYELMGLRLCAELVVLSACETARGETTGGDEVLGLIGAGAQAAVVSLWPVGDVSTSLLMGEFYRHLRDGDTPAAALQAAQHYLRNLEPEGIDEEVKNLKVGLEGSEAGATVLAALTETQAARHAGPAGPTGRLTVPEDYSHPYYWAPFILVGSVRPNVAAAERAEAEQ